MLSDPMSNPKTLSGVSPLGTLWILVFSLWEKCHSGQYLSKVAFRGQRGIWMSQNPLFAPAASLQLWQCSQAHFFGNFTQLGGLVNCISLWIVNLQRRGVSTLMFGPAASTHGGSFWSLNSPSLSSMSSAESFKEIYKPLNVIFSLPFHLYETSWWLFFLLSVSTCVTVCVLKRCFWVGALQIGGLQSSPVTVC